MWEVLRIRDLEQAITRDGRTVGFLCFDLRDLVALIEDEGPMLSWAAVPMGEGMDLLTDESPAGMSARDFQIRVDDSANGISLTWEELGELSGVVYQTIWGTFVGYRPGERPEEWASLFQDDWCYIDRAKPALYQFATVCFQAVDSSFWLVYAQDERIRAKFRERFKSVETVIVEAKYLS